MIQVFTDGGARGNPGEAAVGIVVAKNGSVVAEIGQRIGVATNNIVEYQAVLIALSWLIENKDLVIGNEIVFNLDSKLVVSQLTGVYKVKNAGLRELLFKIRVLEAKLRQGIRYRYIPREENTKADALVNKALDNLL